MSEENMKKRLETQKIIEPGSGGIRDRGWVHQEGGRAILSRYRPPGDRGVKRCRQTSRDTSEAVCKGEFFIKQGGHPGKKADQPKN